MWKAYIDFEINLEEYDKTRDLYERLLKRTQHVKVVFFIIISYIDFEINLEEYDKTRDLYERLLKRTQHVKVVFFNYFP